ncbi:MAG TPA: glutamate synthase subunit beta [Kofleriaceae bacterium]|nr:glutamate synthase subunit beta [Kofleriaceae bacterium]
MGKPTGFIEHARLVPRKRPVAERVRDWREVDAEGGPLEGDPRGSGLLEADAIRTQAGRCMDCGVPFCTQGCPLGNPIPDFADLVWRDRWHDAHRRLAATNDFPEFTGRLCPAPCEAACVLAIDPTEAGRPGPAGEAAGLPTLAGGGIGAVTTASAVTIAGAVTTAGAVTIEAIEKAIAERAFAEGWITPQPPRARTGKRIAIVGSGPAGLAAAAQLNRAGHTVTVYEAAARPGGLLRYGIPDFKLEKHVIDRRLAILEAEGVELRCGAPVGADPTWDRLRREHDAVLIAIGARRARDLDVPGRDLPGVVLAMDYLTEQNEVIGGERPAARWDVRGQRVVILGGGDTGSDCLGTAHRQGAAHTTQLELHPAPPAVRAADNPWPRWPLVFRTSSSQEEGGERAFSFRTTRLSAGPDGRLAALHGVRVALEGGRLVDQPEPGPLGAELTLPADTLILALGFTGPETAPLALQLGVALDARGNIATDARGATNVPGVYCAGDAHRGASLIVWAIAEAREAARALDAELRGGPSVIPARGQDRPFG